MKTTLLLITLFFTLSVSAQPVADCTVDRVNICSGTTIQLINSSTGAHAFEWKINGIHYSYASDTVATLYEPCYDLLPIRLIATDTITGTVDSDLVTVEVFDSCYFHWTGDFFSCAGDTVILGVSPEEIATEFVINPPQTLLSGCLTCPSISFVLSANGVMVDRKSTYVGGCYEITSYHYLCLLSAGENEKRTLNSYPNPVTGFLYIESSFPYTASLLDVNGNTVIRNVSPPIDCTFLPAGLYILAVKDGSGNIDFRKIIKASL